MQWNTILPWKGQANRRYMAQLYAAYHGIMFSYALKLLGTEAEAEDAIVQAMENMARHVDTLRTLPCGELRSYAVSTVRNVCYNRLTVRRREQARVVPLESAAHLTSAEPSVEEAFRLRHNRQKLLAAVKMLQGLEKQVLTMKYLDGCTTREIAQTLHLADSSVRVYLMRAKKKLYDMLKEDYIDEM